MALTDQQKKARDGKLTASRVACLMTGDKEKILNLWREMVGDPAYVEENLDDVWAVQFGAFTESFHLDWIERKLGKIVGRGDVITREDKPWMAATLDGWIQDKQLPVEVKCTGGYEKADVVIARYQPQLQWQMMVTGKKMCAFSVIYGGKEPVVEFVPLDADYAAELLKRAEQFMECVRTMTPPVALPAVAAPVKAERVYDYSESNAWVYAATDWLENRLAADKFEEAAKDLKALVPSDAQKVIGGGVVAQRDKANRLKIVKSDGDKS